MTENKAGKVAVLWAWRPLRHVGRQRRRTTGTAACSTHSQHSVIEGRNPPSMLTRLVDEVSCTASHLRRRPSSGSIPSPRDRTGSGSTSLLRDVASQGVWVSAHPDVILKMGVKEVLFSHKTSRLGHRDPSLSLRQRLFAKSFRCDFSISRSPGPQNKTRGNGGQGRVESRADSGDHGCGRRSDTARRGAAAFRRICHLVRS